jgi:hypothetical protein
LAESAGKEDPEPSINGVKSSLRAASPVAIKSCGGPRARQPGTGKPKEGLGRPSMVIPWRASRGRRNARKGVGWQVCPVIEKKQTCRLKGRANPR